LRYVYAGNLPGRVGELENTHCHQCDEMLIRRRGYFIEEYQVTPEGNCPACQTPLPGRWSTQFDGQIADRPFLPRQRAQLVKILTRQ
jgi:hypothetical protein